MAPRRGSPRLSGRARPRCLLPDARGASALAAAPPPSKPPDHRTVGAQPAGAQTALAEALAALVLADIERYPSLTGLEGK
jgi:hypothetical protein